MKKFYLIACILVLMLVGSLGACIPPPEEKIPPIAEAIPIDPDQIRLEFEADRDAARAKWEGKLVSVTGTVEDTSEQWKMATLVSGKSIAEGGADAHCRIPDLEVVRSLQKGQQITVVGTFHEYMIAAKRVVIVDCYVIQ